MKIMISFLSFVVILAGVLHFLPDTVPIPHTGLGYSIILIALGVVLMLAAFLNNLLMGTERFFLIIEAAAVVFIGILPLLPSFLTFLPKEGLLYGGMVIAVGAITMIYGMAGIG